MVISGWGELHSNALKKSGDLESFKKNLLKVQCVDIQHFY